MVSVSNFPPGVLIPDQMHFKLSGRALGSLLEIFAFNDFSVKRFLSGYKFCMFEHFADSVINAKLCVPNPEREKGRKGQGGKDQDSRFFTQG